MERGHPKRNFRVFCFWGVSEPEAGVKRVRKKLTRKEKWDRIGKVEGSSRNWLLI
jgi:hypothetical protein